MTCYLQNITACLVITFGMAFAQPALSASLEEEFRRVGDVVQQALGTSKSIDVREFTDINAQTSVSGRIAAGLKAQFLKECEALQLVQNDQADHVLLATYSVNDRRSIEANEPLTLEVEFSLKTRRGRSPVEIAPIRVDIPRVTIDEPSVIGEALGLVGMVSTQPVAESSPSDLTREELARLALEPTGVANQSKIKSNANSPLEVQIFTRDAKSQTEYQPVTAQVSGGQPFVDIPVGHEYQIHIINHSTNPFAVATSIDGLSVFHFADNTCRDPTTGRLSIKHQLVWPAQKMKDGVFTPRTTELHGWIFSAKGMDNSRRFLVTNYGKEDDQDRHMAASTKQGSIHMQFFPCKQVEVIGNKRGSKATAPGASDTIRYQKVEVTATAPGEFLTIRYDR